MYLFFVCEDDEWAEDEVWRLGEETNFCPFLTFVPSVEQTVNQTAPTAIRPCHISNKWEIEHARVLYLDALLTAFGIHSTTASFYTLSLSIVFYLLL